MFTDPSAPRFGALIRKAPDERYLFYWMFYLFLRHVGANVLAISGTSPWYIPPPDENVSPKPEQAGGPLAPALVTSSADGHTLYTVVANASWETKLACNLKLSHFSARSARGLVLSQKEANAPALVDRMEDVVSKLELQSDVEHVTFTLPADSVAFITIE